MKAGVLATVLLFGLCAAEAALAQASPSGVTLPALTGPPIPSSDEYPSVSLDRGDQGVTVLRLFVIEDGSVVDADIMTSSGHPRLDHAAIGMIKEDWKFKPGTRNGVPARMWTDMQVRWVIPEKRPSPTPFSPGAVESEYEVDRPGAAEFTLPRPIGENPVTFKDYPRISLMREQSGTVMLNVLVGEDGRVNDVDIVTSSGHPRLDHAAAGLVMEEWRYGPATRAGMPVDAWAHVRVIWQLGAISSLRARGNELIAAPPRVPRGTTGPPIVIDGSQ